VSPGEQVDALLKKVARADHRLLEAWFAKKLGRRMLLEVAQDFEDAAGVLRSIAGVRDDDDPKRGGTPD